MVILSLGQSQGRRGDLCHLTARILNLYTEALIGFCLQYHAEWSQQCTALKALEKGPTWEQRAECTCQGQERVSILQPPKLSSQFNHWSHSLMTSPNTLPFGTSSANPACPPPAFFYALENSARGFTGGAGSFGGSLTALEQMSQKM